MATTLTSGTPVDIDAMKAVEVPPGATAATHDAPGGDALLGLYRRARMELVRGQGVELFDAEGRAYFDFVSGIAVNALGYNDPGLMAAIREATERSLVHVSNLYRTAPGERLAAWFVAHSFADRVFFCNSGAEANEGAIKFARRWARGLAGADEAAGAAKHEIVSLRGAFHGRLFASLAATDRPGYRAPFRPLAGGVSIAERDLMELDSVLHAETTAAVIVEPVQGESGVRVLDAGFLRELRAMTAERQIALIFDEIQCGLGRLGHLFAYERVNVVPDMVTLAKPLAGGLPMGAVLMTEAIASAMKPGDHGTTFGGGPLVASVAEYVVQRLADPALLASVRENGQWLGGALEAMAERTGRVRAVRGVGYMWGIDTHEPAAQIVARALELGLLLVTAGEHTLRLLPPLVATRDDLARGVELLERAIGAGGVS